MFVGLANNVRLVQNGEIEPHAGSVPEGFRLCNHRFSDRFAVHDIAFLRWVERLQHDGKIVI